MASWFWLFLYLQWGQPWQMRWRQWREGGRRLAVDWRAYCREIEELDTPWRLASWMDAHLTESPRARWLDPPAPPEMTWARREGGPADFAAFAVAAMTAHHIPARFVTVMAPPLGRHRTLRPSDMIDDPLAPEAVREPHLWHGHVVCAIQDQETGGWFHLSNWGMFGVFAHLDELAADVSPRWGAYVMRDPSFRLLGWRRRDEAAPGRSAGPA